MFIPARFAIPLLFGFPVSLRAAQRTGDLVNCGGVVYGRIMKQTSLNAERKKPLQRHEPL